MDIFCLKMVIVSACLPLHFVGTSRAHLPPSRSSVTVFPVSHKRTCWRKTLAAHWENGPLRQVRYKHKFRFVFPFFPSFFSFSFFPFSFHLVLLSNSHGLLVSCFLSLSLSLSNPLYSYPMNKELYAKLSVLRTFVPLHRITHGFLCGGGNVFPAMVLDNL